MPDELKLLAEWKNRLGLQDWCIVLKTNVKPEDMKLEDAEGCAEYVETTKSAEIQILAPEYRVAVREYDFEEVLVHELLHLKLCLLERGTDWDNKLQLRLLHTIIDDLARAFISAKRAGERNESNKMDKLG